MNIYTLIISLGVVCLASACDTAPEPVAACEPAAALPLTPGQNGSLAVTDAAGCRTEVASAVAGPAEFLYGPERDFEREPTFLVVVAGPLNDGAQVNVGFSGDGPPPPGSYPVVDLRGSSGQFGAVPVRFEPGRATSLTTNGDGQGFWFATGGEVVIERSDADEVSGAARVEYLHGGGGRPVEVRGRFRAVPGGVSYVAFTNPHGG